MEYYVVTHSFAAPFCSDVGHRYVEAPDPRAALESVSLGYSHPYGLYSAGCYSSADAKNKGEKPLAQWLSNHARRMAELAQGGCVVRQNGYGEIEVDGVWHKVADPKGGSVVEAA